MSAISPLLKEAVEKPSTRLFVKSGITSPARDGRTLEINPIISAALGMFVDKINLKNGFKPVSFSFNVLLSCIHNPHYIKSEFFPDLSMFILPLDGFCFN